MDFVKKCPNLFFDQLNNSYYCGSCSYCSRDICLRDSLCEVTRSSDFLAGSVEMKLLSQPVQLTFDF